MFAAWLKSHFTLVWNLVFLASAIPALLLAAQFASKTLGPNPLATLLHTSGRSALALLSASLGVTPLRRLLTQVSVATHMRYGKRMADWNWLIRLRRQLGLWCFAYALLHAWLFLALDLGYDWQAGREELGQKPYLFAGAAALAMLVPLAATSTPGMIRRLGRNWRRLHMLSYVVALTALLHFWWMMKPGVWTPWPDSAILAVLLGYRAALRIGVLARWDGWDGSASQERASRQA